MRDFRGMILAPGLLLATAATAVTVSTVEVGVNAQKLDSMTQKLKKDCEDQGGTFVLQNASAKHDPAPLDRYSGEGRLDQQRTDEAHKHPLGGTAYQAGGVCTTTSTVGLPPFTLDFSPPKP